MISVVIVNWNSGPRLERCVQSLRANAAGCQIVIADNASTDSSLRFADGIDGLRLLRSGRNNGFAAACNTGWRASEGDPVLFLNPDTECLPGSVECLAQTLAADTAVWAAGGQLVGPSGKPQSGFNVRRFPSIGAVAAEMLMIDEIWASNPWSRPGSRAGGAAEDVDQPAAACLMVCRDALELTEGFDESFRPAWFEDVDLCRRIRNQGGRIRFQPKARFLHHGGYSLERLSRRDFLEFYHLNQIRYFRKHHGTRAASRVRRLVVAGLLIRAAISIAYPLAPNASRTEAARTFWRVSRTISREGGNRP